MMPKIITVLIITLILSACSDPTAPIVSPTKNPGPPCGGTYLNTMSDSTGYWICITITAH